MDYEKMSIMEVIERHLSPQPTADTGINVVGESESKYGRKFDKAVHSKKNDGDWVNFRRLYGGHRNV